MCDARPEALRGAEGLSAEADGVSCGGGRGLLAEADETPRGGRVGGGSSLRCRTPSPSDECPYPPPLRFGWRSTTPGVAPPRRPYHTHRLGEEYMEATAVRISLPLAGHKTRPFQIPTSPHPPPLGAFHPKRRGGGSSERGGSSPAAVPLETGGSGRRRVDFVATLPPGAEPTPAEDQRRVRGDRRSGSRRIRAKRGEFAPRLAHTKRGGDAAGPRRCEERRWDGRPRTDGGGAVDDGNGTADRTGDGGAMRRAIDDPRSAGNRRRRPSHGDGDLPPEKISPSRRRSKILMPSDPVVHLHHLDAPRPAVRPDTRRYRRSRARTYASRCSFQLK